MTGTEIYSVELKNPKITQKKNTSVKEQLFKASVCRKTTQESLVLALSFLMHHQKAPAVGQATAKGFTGPASFLFFFGHAVQHVGS